MNGNAVGIPTRVRPSQSSISRGTIPLRIVIENLAMPIDGGHVPIPAKALKSAEPTGGERRMIISDIPDAVVGDAITLRFGSVELQTVRDPVAFAANVKAGQEALRRAKEAMVTPGIKLRMPHSIPRYFADPSDPSLLIRELRGKRQAGRLVNGKFITT